MNKDGLKKLIKEVVKEAIKEELGDVLLEILKSKTSPTTNVSNTPTLPSHSSLEEKRQQYANILNETKDKMAGFSSNNTEFHPNTNYDPTNGTLPEGEVSLSTISSLLP